MCHGELTISMAIFDRYNCESLPAGLEVNLLISPPGEEDVTLQCQVVENRFGRGSSARSQSEVAPAERANGSPWVGDGWPLIPSGNETWLAGTWTISATLQEVVLAYTRQK